jgi:hypothetical protein
MARPGGGQTFRSGGSTSTPSRSAPATRTGGSSTLNPTRGDTSGGAESSSFLWFSGERAGSVPSQRPESVLGKRLLSIAFWGIAITALWRHMISRARRTGWTTAAHAPTEAFDVPASEDVSVLPTSSRDEASRAANAAAAERDRTERRKRRTPAKSNVASEPFGGEQPRRRRRDVPAAIAEVGGSDPDFSWIVFEDFVSALYAAVHARRGEGKLDDLSPYFSDDARRTYAALPAAKVEHVLLGSLSDPAVFAVVAPSPHVEVQVILIGNFTEVDRTGRSRRYVSNERWSLRRGASAVSRTPEEARVLGCPNCGAPVGTHVGAPIERGHRCPFCKELVDTGEFDWRVAAVEVRERAAISLTGADGGAESENEHEEAGTALATVVDPEAHDRFEALVRRDQSQHWGDFVARATMIFQTFQRAWSNDDLPLMRPFLSDNLYAVQAQYLADARAAGLRNQVEDPVLISVELARVLHDRYFDAVTVRLRASCKDFTLDRHGKLVAGSRTRPRVYTEYWTLIRSATRQGGARADSLCPHCGATHQVNMAGECRHCHVKITAGTFDWVLSRIEQDEVYRVL